MSLSALADGRPEDADRAVAAWSADADARKTWHAYQLIGDVLRSDDLATPADRDEAFLLRLRQQLAKEPVVLAPQIMVGQSLAGAAAARRSPPRRLNLRWSAAAAFAGVALVGGVFLTVQKQSGDAAMLAKSAGPAGSSGVVTSQSFGATVATPIQRVSTGAASTPPAGLAAAPQAQEWNMLDERDLRDARLQSYLRAHRGGAGVGARVEPVVLGR